LLEKLAWGSRVIVTDFPEEGSKFRNLDRHPINRHGSADENGRFSPVRLQTITVRMPKNLKSAPFPIRPVRVKPIVLIDKDLPCLPGSKDDLKRLKTEIDELRKENRSLHCQIATWVDQVQRCNQVTEAARVLAEKKSSGRHLQHAIEALVKAENVLAEEWKSYHKEIRDHVGQYERFCTWI
jgi:FtsZ-binding cell division protein ZapB